MTDLIEKEKAIEALYRAEALTKAFGYHNVIDTIREMPTVEAVPIDWIEEWCLSQDLEYVRIAIKKMMDNWKAERKEE